jgi:hypothetical protein
VIKLTTHEAGDDHAEAIQISGQKVTIVDSGK